MLNGRSDVFLAKLVARGDLEKNVLARQPRDDLINGKKIKRKGKGKQRPLWAKTSFLLSCLSRQEECVKRDGIFLLTKCVVAQVPSSDQTWTNSVLFSPLARAAQASRPPWSHVSGKLTYIHRDRSVFDRQVTVLYDTAVRTTLTGEQRFRESRARY